MAGRALAGAELHACGADVVQLGGTCADQGCAVEPPTISPLFVGLLVSLVCHLWSVASVRGRALCLVGALASPRRRASANLCAGVGMVQVGRVWRVCFVSSYPRGFDH